MQVFNFSLFKIHQILPTILDPAVGIISSLRESPIEVDSPSFFRFIATASNTQAFCKYKNFYVGGGAALFRDVAITKAVGEAVERYCAAIYDVEELPLFSYNSAPFECISPEKFALYRTDQYEHKKFYFRPFTRDSLVRWIGVVNLSDSSTVYVPASMVYVPYYFYEGEKEVPIAQPISTGLSCHSSYDQAVIGGICEVIERDNFTITWQAQMSRVKIKKKSLSKFNQDLVDRFERVGYEIHLMDMSNETKIPGILVVAVNNYSKFVPIAVAAAVDLSPERAIRKALEELAHTERYVYQIKNETPRIEIQGVFDNIIGQFHHVSLWLDPELRKNAEFLYSSNEWKDFADIPDFSASTAEEELKLLVSQINSTGYEVLAVDITTQDVKDLGLCVVRVIIPGYHPLFMGYHNRSLGGHRLWTIPQKLGFKGISIKTGRDFFYPHPFP